MAMIEQASQGGESLVGIIQDLDPPIARLSKLVQHLSIIADRVEGSRPQEAACAVGVDTPPHSTIDNLRRKRGSFSMLCQQLETEVTRIDRAIGGGGELAGAGVGSKMTNRIA